METVALTRMEDGTAEDYALLDRADEEHMAGVPGGLITALEELKVSFSGYQVTRYEYSLRTRATNTRYEHALQSATRVYGDGMDEEYVAMLLLRDLGDQLAPLTDGEMMRAILRPCVRPDLV